MTFDELITPEERREVEAGVEELCHIMRMGTMLCANIVDFIDARFDGKA